MLGLVDSLFDVVTALTCVVGGIPMALHACITKDMKQLQKMLQFFLLWGIVNTALYPVLDPIMLLVPYHLWAVLKLCFTIVMLLPNSERIQSVFTAIETMYDLYGHRLADYFHTRVIDPAKSNFATYITKLKANSQLSAVPGFVAPAS